MTIQVTDIVVHDACDAYEAISRSGTPCSVAGMRAALAVAFAPASEPDPNVVRREFEVWCRAEGDGNVFDLRRDGMGSYLSPTTMLLWVGYRAGAFAEAVKADSVRDGAKEGVK